MLKGTLKKTNANEHICERTNFSDWSDPKCILIKRPIESTKKEDINLEVLTENSPKLGSFISQTSVEIEMLREKIKNGYPLLSQKEIRRVRLPFYESLVINLKEDGFILASEFIKDLIASDEEWHILQERQSSAKSRPLLRESPPTLKILCEGLTKAEISKRDGHFREETKVLLDMAIQFANSDDHSWNWLAEELYEQSVSVGEDLLKCTEIDNEMKAVAKHTYAKFLLDILNDPERSRQLVEESMELSIGKFWNPSEITGQPSDILYLESCFLLHRVFLQLAHQLQEYDLERAIQLCRSSLHWAKQINCKSAEAKALLSLAMIYLAAQQHSPILSNLQHYMKLCIDLEDYEGLCEGHILMAQYHEQLDEDELLLEDLKNLIVVAKERNILKMKALAYRKLALYYLVQGDEKEMQKYSVKAYRYCGQLNTNQDIEEARCLTGIAQAQEIMPHYLSIVLDADTVNASEFEHLMLWKNLRIPFFSNIKLFQLEAEDNMELRDRIERMKIDELITATQAKQAELISKPSSHINFNKLMSLQSQSVPRMSTSVMNFHNQLKNALLVSESVSQLSFPRY